MDGLNPKNLTFLKVTWSAPSVALLATQATTGLSPAVPLVLLSVKLSELVPLLLPSMVT